LSIVHRFGDFLLLYSQTLKELMEKDKSFSKSTPELQEKLILFSMAEKNQKNKGPPLFISDCDRNLAKNKLEGLLNQIFTSILKGQKETEALTLFAPFLSKIFTHFLDKIFTPDFLAIAFDRLMMKDFPLMIESETTPLPFIMLSERDKKFEKNLGTEIDKIAKATLTLLRLPFLVSKTISAFVPDEQTLGEIIHKVLMEVAAEDTIAEQPIVMLNQLLFEEEEPVLLKIWLKSEEEIKEFAKPFQEQIPNLIGARIIELVKKEDKGRLVKLVTSIPKVEQVVDRLGREIFALSQRPVIMRVFLSFLLLGLIEGLNLSFEQIPKKCL
jgi:hypothetical protein